MIEQAHWERLPDGRTRATTTAREVVEPERPGSIEPLSALLTRRHADLTVAARPLTDYTNLANPKEEP